MTYSVDIVGKPEKRDPLGGLGVDRIILKCILNKRKCEGVDCIHLTQKREQWPPVVETVMDLWVP
jgi:hypothetical protein